MRHYTVHELLKIKEEYQMLLVRAMGRQFTDEEHGDISVIWDHMDLIDMMLRFAGAH